MSAGPHRLTFHDVNSAVLGSYRSLSSSSGRKIIATNLRLWALVGGFAKLNTAAGLQLRPLHTSTPDNCNMHDITSNRVYSQAV